MVDADKTFHETEPLEVDELKDFFEKKLGKPIIQFYCPTNIQADYHKIYIISVSENEEEDLFLRVSKPYLDGVKTRNEVASMKWTRENIPACPLPKVIAWSDSTDEIGYEYVVLNRIIGRDMYKSWASLSEEQINHLIKTVALIFVEMASKPFDKLGGLTYDNILSAIIPGPIVEETTYSVEDIYQYWPKVDYPDITLESLQIGGPFESLADYINARLEGDIIVTLNHKSCEPLKIKRFSGIDSNNSVSFIEEMKSVLETLNLIQLRSHINSKPLAFAHHDLHMANIMLDDNGRISGILDWEFAGIVPVDEMIRRNTFAWRDGKAEEYAKEWRGLLKKEIVDLYPYSQNDFESDKIKDAVVKIISLTFWIVKCTVLGTQAEDREKWIDSFHLLKAELEEVVSL